MVNLLKYTYNYEHEIDDQPFNTTWLTLNYKQFFTDIQINLLELFKAIKRQNKFLPYDDIICYAILYACEALSLKQACFYRFVQESLIFCLNSTSISPLKFSDVSTDYST